MELPPLCEYLLPLETHLPLSSLFSVILFYPQMPELLSNGYLRIQDSSWVLSPIPLLPESIFLEIGVSYSLVFCALLGFRNPVFTAILQSHSLFLLFVSVLDLLGEGGGTVGGQGRGGRI